MSPSDNEVITFRTDKFLIFFPRRMHASIAGIQEAPRFISIPSLEPLDRNQFLRYAAAKMLGFSFNEIQRAIQSIIWKAIAFPVVQANVFFVVIALCARYFCI